MNTMIRNRVSLICLCLSHCINAFSQPEITLFTDIGNTNVTQEYFLKSATIGQYGFGKNQVEVGFLFNLKSMNDNAFTGYRLQASRELPIKNLTFDLQAFWVQTFYSDLLRETNWGFQIRIPMQHFETIFGTEFRTYAFRDDAIQAYGIEDDAAKMNEPVNLVYSFTYYLKPPDTHWNAGISITNFDYFIVNQENNPILSLKGLYKFKAPISLVTQIWYEASGVLSSYANYYGFFFRTGIIWYIQ